MHIFPLLASLLLLSGCGAVGITMATIGKGVQVGNQSRTAGTAIDDLTIETTINHRYFRQDLNDLFQNVDADVIEGRVFLTGNVKQHATMLKAVNLAWEVQNVREVINEIQVENTSDVADAARDIWMELQIEGELLITKGIISPNYNVESVNGIITLMGIAQSDAELHKVTDIASRTAGVQQVLSHVIMKDDPRRIISKAPNPLNTVNTVSNPNSYYEPNFPDSPDSSDYYNEINIK